MQLSLSSLRLPGLSIKADRWLLGILALAFVLRLVGLTNEALWYDEAFTAVVAGLPVDRAITALLNDVHPPAWYLIERAFGYALGFNAFSMRLPSLICGVLSALELYNLVKLLSGINEARIASAIYAVMPAALYYGQEARMYTWLTLLVLLGTRAALQKNNRLLVPTLSLAMLTHNLGAVYCLPIGLLAVSRNKKAWWAIGIAALAYSPWLGGLWHQLTMINDRGFWIPQMGIGSAFFYILFTTWFTRLPAAISFHAGLLSMVLTAAGGLMAFKHREKMLPLLIVSFAPPALLYLVSVVWKPMMLDRALMPAGAGVLGLWGFLLVKLSKLDRAAILAVLLPALLVGVATYYRPTNYQDTRPGARIDTRIPADYIRDRWRDHDVVYHMIVESSVTYLWYMPDKPNYTILGEGRIDRNLTIPTQEAMAIYRVAFDDLYGLGYRRAWFIWYDTPIVPDVTIRDSQDIINSHQVLQEVNFINKEQIHYKVYLLLLEPSPASPDIAMPATNSGNK